MMLDKTLYDLFNDKDSILDQSAQARKRIAERFHSLSEIRPDLTENLVSAITDNKSFPEYDVTEIKHLFRGITNIISDHADMYNVLCHMQIVDLGTIYEYEFTDADYRAYSKSPQQFVDAQMSINNFLIFHDTQGRLYDPNQLMTSLDVALMSDKYKRMFLDAVPAHGDNIFVDTLDMLTDYAVKKDNNTMIDGLYQLADRELKSSSKKTLHPDKLKMLQAIIIDNKMEYDSGDDIIKKNNWSATDLATMKTPFVPIIHKGRKDIPVSIKNAEIIYEHKQIHPDKYTIYSNDKIKLGTIADALFKDNTALDKPELRRAYANIYFDPMMAMYGLSAISTNHVSAKLNFLEKCGAISQEKYRQASKKYLNTIIFD